jgi:hypothetical protein
VKKADSVQSALGRQHVLQELLHYPLP